MSSHPFNGRRVSKAVDAEDIAKETLGGKVAAGVFITEGVSITAVAKGNGWAVEWPIDASVEKNDKSSPESGLCIVPTSSMASAIVPTASMASANKLLCSFTTKAVSFDNFDLISATMLLNNDTF